MKASTSWNPKGWELGGVILLLGIWALLSSGDSALLPPPWVVIREAGTILLTAENQMSFASSVFRGFYGIGGAVAAGAGLGFAAGLNGRIECLLRPAMAMLKATPVMSIIILLIFWFQTERVPVVVGFTIGLPIVYHAVLQGVRQVDVRLLEMAQVFRVPPIRRFLLLYVPALLPYLVAGMDSAIGIGWKSVIAAEVVCQPRYGIGTQLMNAKYNLSMEPLFAWTLLAILLSYGIELAVRALHRRLSRWQT